MHNTGKFNKRITFQKIVQKTDSLGDHPVPVDVATRWASVRAVRGSEYYEAQKLRPEKAYVINCRYFLVDGEEISSEMQIQYKGRTLEIVTAINIDEEDQEYEIHATERGEKKVRDYV
ncbi:MAG: phage head closure protein [Lachnospiraceae bacterium]|nr:phage head closure protein [Lachnospiraceae bacterium]